eukprot:6207195-Pleurochrysis_carterae.AAC.3
MIWVVSHALGGDQVPPRPQRGGGGASPIRDWRGNPISERQHPTNPVRIEVTLKREGGRGDRKQIQIDSDSPLLINICLALPEQEQGHRT